jgi:hypothetical protein
MLIELIKYVLQIACVIFLADMVYCWRERKEMILLSMCTPASARVIHERLVEHPNRPWLPTLVVMLLVMDIQQLVYLNDYDFTFSLTDTGRKFVQHVRKRELDEALSE